MFRPRLCSIMVNELHIEPGSTNLRDRESNRHFTSFIIVYEVSQNTVRLIIFVS